MTVLQVEVVKAVMAPVRAPFLRRVLQRAASVAEVAARLPEDDAIVAVRITGDQEMQVLNRTYADVPDATDVLSFAGVAPHLGDIAISWPAVERQAARYRHEPQTEVALLAVHGLLHLLGWDHATSRERREMTRLTLAALERSGLRPSSRRL